MAFPVSATFKPAPNGTVFIVNVIHARPGRQEDAFQAIQEVEPYVARTKPGFLWSNPAKSTDGKTVVNIEAISGGRERSTNSFPIRCSWKNSANSMWRRSANSTPTKSMTWCCLGGPRPEPAAGRVRASAYQTRSPGANRLVLAPCLCSFFERPFQVLAG